MQAIQTKYFGPTNFRGSRVKATCAGLSRMTEWDDELGSAENHLRAAYALASKLGWKWEFSRIVSGTLKDGSSVHCYDYAQASNSDARNDAAARSIEAASDLQCIANSLEALRHKIRKDAPSGGDICTELRAVIVRIGEEIEAWRNS